MTADDLGQAFADADDHTPEPAALAFTEIDHAVKKIARQTGVTFTSRPVWPGALSQLELPESAEAMRIAGLLERAARRVIRDYVGHARGTGMTWQEIGAALDLSAEAADRNIHVAEAAFDFAAGQPSSPWDNPSVTWICRSCGEVIHDRGPAWGHPEDDEPSHAPGCERFAAMVAAWEANKPV